MLVNILIFNFLLVTTVSAQEECGTRKFMEPQIVDGSQITRGEWPFIAALFYTNDAKFFCGGTLISAKHVLTAAHCVQQKNSALKLTPEDVVVLLGAYNIDSKIERGVQQKYVAAIYVHPDWKVYHERYDADIAIFVLIDVVVFTNYTRAICIPEDEDVFHGVSGSIVGWGLAENTSINKHESIPRHAFTTALNDSYCYTSDQFLALFSSPRTFCGGGEGGSPNKGDSGGGFFVRSGSLWMQYGIISASIGDASGVVLPNSFSVYTNVKSFKSWIENIVQRSDNGEHPGNLAEKPKIKFFCSYEPSYKCSVWESNATVENLEVEAFTGTHLPGHSDQNVTTIWFWHGIFAYIPDGIGLLFPHLESFLVGYDDRNLGLKQIKRSNFKNMKSLKLLQLHKSNIEKLDGDTLWDFPNLEVFELVGSQLEVLPKNLFETNTRLRRVKANSNQIQSLPGELFKHNPLIAEVYLQNNKLRLIYTDFTALKAVTTLDLHGNSCIDKALDDNHNVAELQQFIRNNCK